MRVLYLASKPVEESPLRLEAEISALQAALKPGAEAVRFEVYPNLTIEQLPLILANAAADVLHISAHADAGELLFADEYGEPAPVSGAMLADLLRAVKARPRLIVINACESREIACSLAPCADFTIGVSAPVSNLAARNMTAILYSRLADGATVGDAFGAARVILLATTQGKTDAHLTSDPGVDPLQVRLSERLRLMACLPALDEALEAGRGRPPNLLKGDCVTMEFGAVGAPIATVQLVVFTDDESFVGDDEDEDEEDEDEEDGLESDLAWIRRGRPVAGAIWLDAEGEASGDCRWFATVVTAEGAIHSTSSTLVEALNRYYVDEAWAGVLPPAYAEALQGALTWLRANDGSRRQHNRLRSAPG